MAGSQPPRPSGTDKNTPAVGEGTRPLATVHEPGPVGATGTPAADGSGAQRALSMNDPAIEVLQLADTARRAAYALKRAHPSVVFTSGRRSKEEQASAMASNVVRNRKWIEETYLPTTLSAKCQEWVDRNPDKKTQADIARGLASIIALASDADLGKLSKHLSGEAFDVQPVEKDADAIKNTIRALPGLGKFLDKEGGLVRWHAQF
jgi:hypothetical protein